MCFVWRVVDSRKPIYSKELMSKMKHINLKQYLTVLPSTHKGPWLGPSFGIGFSGRIPRARRAGLKIPHDGSSERGFPASWE